MTDGGGRQVPKRMVQEVVKQIAAPAPVVVQQAPVMATPIVETFAPAPIMSASIAAPIMSAPIVETFGAGYGTGIVGGGIGYGAPVVETIGAGYGTGIGFGAPVVETFGAGYGTGIGFGAPVVETFGSTLAPSFATAPLVGSISAGLPMTTMAAPTMTTMGATVGAFGSPLVGTSYGLPPTVL